MKRYNDLSSYLKNKFGERVLKICIDGGFTCPNRDGTVSYGGCIFCTERGSGDHLSNSNNISDQVRNYFNTYRAKRANKFIAYFQNFTNTYDKIENLKKKYDSALIDDRIVALAIATRPDAINDDIAKLIKSYSDKYYVFVELGLQTSNDDTAKLINRGYETKKFSEAVDILNKYNIDVVVHIMVGLPNESKENVIETVNFLNKHKIQGIKIHSCYVVKNTKLENMYMSGKYSPITLEEYLDSLSYILTHIPKDIVIHRLSADAPKDLLVTPSWNIHKKWVINGIDNKLQDENLYQGMYYDKDNN